jgi:tRNA dimethylallyltransferase
LAETITLVKTRTRQFAKRQMTWFRGQMGADWIEVKPDDSPESVAALVKARIGS